MFNPRKQFDQPDWPVLTAEKAEGQYYERKVTSDPEKLAEAISGFANRNPQGALIVNGIEDGGNVKGLDHLGPDKLNQLQKCVTFVTHRVEQKLVRHPSPDSVEVTLQFIYVPFSPDRVVQTSKGKAFERIGDSTRELKYEERKELEHTKGQAQFEDAPACPLQFDELQEDVLKELYLMVKERDGISAETSPERILLNRHLALQKDGGLNLTNAGLLLLAKDPKKYIPGAYVRFLRYSGKEARTGKEQNLIKDQEFSGPIPQVIHRLRDFMKAQLKEFSYRAKDGLFVSEPEYPEEAWDEAIVNALVHRSYSYRNVAVFIRMFDDRLEVISPGDYPKGIRPEDFRENPLSNPRNPHMMEIMKALRFVKMISEGTKRMIAAMEMSSLPPPTFSQPGKSHVTVILRNDIERRISERTGADAQTTTSSFGNLFLLDIVGPAQAGPIPDENVEPLDTHGIRNALITALRDGGYAVDSFTGSLAVDFRREYPIEALRSSRIVSIYPAIKFRVFEFGSDRFVCLDHAVEVRNRATLARLISLVPPLKNRGISKGFYRRGKTWHPCYIRTVSEHSAIVEPLGSPGQNITAAAEDVLPSLPTPWISDVLEASGVRFDLSREIKRLSLSNMTGAARQRAEKTIEIAKELRQQVFPLEVHGYQVNLSAEPRQLAGSAFRLCRDLNEPEPVFTQEGKTKSTVTEGLLELGSYEKPRQTIPLAILCTAETVQAMKTLVATLSRGSVKYQGVERTFGIKFGHPILLVTDSCEQYVDALTEFNQTRSDHPRPFFVVYAPERGYSRADHKAPYYQVKHFLLEHGYPSQMVDEETLANPRFKELNLALDIFAKRGYAPWVLKEGLPEADLFIGLSYSSFRDRDRLSRVMAWVNVFDKYGRWQYYTGNTVPIPFEQRTAQFRQLIRGVVSDYHSRSMMQRVHVHHGSKLKADDRAEIAKGVLEVVPETQVSFVYVNTRTPVRLYDSRPDGDGSLARGSYVVTAPNQFYISTTGANLLGQKALGTPQPLEVSVRRISAEDELDLRTYAQHILSLTKLNWASSRTFSREPITIKYASDIAYLMNVFMSSFGRFNLHPDLERTAWFL